MEQHPVPRDITGFQFKLVGTMTLKQFTYVAFGAIIGYVCFKAPVGIFSLPLAGIFWFLGFALAFIPIQERPLDRWIAAFIKSVYSPTQFIWHKTPLKIKILSFAFVQKKEKAAPLAHYVDSREKLEKYLETLPMPLEGELEQREKEVLAKTLSFFQESLPKKQLFKKGVLPSQPKKPSPSPAPPSLVERQPKPIVPAPIKVKPQEKKPIKEPEKKLPPEEMFFREKRLKEKIEALKKDLTLKDLSRTRFLELSQHLTQALEEKGRLETELEALRKRVEEKEKKPVVPQEPVLEEEEPRVKIITPKLAPKKGIPHLPQAPNIISGIIKDSLGMVLPGLIVTAKDEKETTVRALKTNNLGLFVSATPLPSGLYTLEIEDPKKKYQFDIIKVTLKGELYSPLEILAKSEREQLREDLTKELFGKN